jgi:hypothetical protein
MDLEQAPPLDRVDSQASVETKRPFFHHRNHSQHSHFVLAHERPSKGKTKEEDPFDHVLGKRTVCVKKTKA